MAVFILTRVRDVPSVGEVVLWEERVVQNGKPRELVINFNPIETDIALYLGTKFKHQNFRFFRCTHFRGDFGKQPGALTIIVGGEIADSKVCRLYIWSYEQDYHV